MANLPVLRGEHDLYVPGLGSILGSADIPGSNPN
jgi:hypothetical protein